MPDPDLSEVDDESSRPDAISRRDLLAGAAGAVGGAVLAGLPSLAVAQQGAKGAAKAALPAPANPLPPIPDDPTKVVGTPTAAVGTRSRFVVAVRSPAGLITGSSFTPLQDLTGTITPADLHFERHHAGIPQIDPARHSLMIHGLVDHPTMFSVDDIKRFPQVTRVHFVECSGNGRGAYRVPKPESTPQQVAGLTSNSEWTGVPVKTLFDEVGVQPAAKWFLAEGSDAAMLTRSIPLEKAFDDAMIVWAQNGEPLQPAQGYPLRLLLPGFEGNCNVKWVRRLELGTKPWMTRWETSVYTDPLPGGKARIFSFELDAKSIITSPTFPKTITKGWWPVSGIAWSGRGTITRVEVSTDSGSSWSDATLHGPALPKAHIRFTHMWEWDGRETTLLSRATDETGYTQPTRSELIKVRGVGTDYHFNQIYGWTVKPDGQVFYHGET
ncbi:MAG: sulfite dehydrogenase [Gemmatimonadaceae bacterium]